MFLLELPHRGDSNEYTQYTIFNVQKEISFKFPESAAIGFGKQAISVVLLYSVFCIIGPFHIAKDRNFIPMTPIEDLTQVVISYVIYQKSLWQVS